MRRLFNSDHALNHGVKRGPLLAFLRATILDDAGHGFRNLAVVRAAGPLALLRDANRSAHGSVWHTAGTYLMHKDAAAVLIIRYLLLFRRLPRRMFVVATQPRKAESKNQGLRIAVYALPF